MKNTENTPHRIDDYLQRIEEREKSARKKKLTLGGIALLVAAAAASLVFVLGRTSEIRKYSIQELSKEKVTEIFDEDDTRIVIAHALGTDTIQSLNEYQSLVDLFEGSNIQSAAFFNPDESNGDDTGDGFESADESEPQNILQKFSVDVSGDRVRGSQLVFTIEDYDPNVNYTLQFGTGYKRKVKRISRYTYSRSGSFRIRLLASSDSRGSSIYTKTIRINSPRVESTTSQREVITEARPVPQNTPQEGSTADLQIEDGATRDLEEADEAGDDDTSTENTTPALSGTEQADDVVEDEEEDAATGVDAEDDTEVEKPATPPADDPVEEKEEETPEIDPNVPIFGAEIMPEFPGGTSGLKRYFQKNYTYPQQAREASIEGTVFVRFVVNVDGGISNIKIIKGLGFGCDKEALRLVGRMPKWIPGEHNGQRVAVYKTLPIGFKLFD